jgi:hypothetical protein
MAGEARKKGGKIESHVSHAYPELSLNRRGRGIIYVQKLLDTFSYFFARGRGRGTEVLKHFKVFF